jgi:uncharacterized membrane protein YhaH (DUF805 family)
MSKICPNCEKENPSVAKFCMFCNTQLVDVEQLSEEDKLRRKNAELQVQLELLKRNNELEKKIEQVEENSSSENDQAVEIRETTTPVSVVQQPSFQGKQPIKPSMFSHSFSFKGRIRRLEFGLSYIIYFVWYIIFSVWMSNESDSAVIGFLLTMIPAVWFFLAQGAKRCHDRNNSGWYQIIPFYFLWMLFAEGDAGENYYGESPK